MSGVDVPSSLKLASLPLSASFSRTLPVVASVRLSSASRNPAVKSPLFTAT
jgi:hypothetical protein